jgi:YjgF/chorismate_mutase-like, putative endoribonuclease
MASNMTPDSYSHAAPNDCNSYCITASSSYYDDDEKMIDAAAGGLRPAYYRIFNSILHENAITIAKYVASMKTEINLSNHYREDLIAVLYKLSIYINSKRNNAKPFRLVTKQDIIAFLDSFRKPDSLDPLHRWIGPYNTYRMHLIRFFKWLYYPDIEPHKRSRPEVVDNIPQLKRKEQSIYKPTDLWTVQDDLLFLKYCPSKRIKCYHAMSRDTGCRPHELLKLRINDIVFRSTGNSQQQYAEVLVNGKTRSRHIPLIDSLPYIKDFLDHISGHGPQNYDGSIAEPIGKVGTNDVSVDQGYESAKLAGLSILGTLKRELGTLDKVATWLQVRVMVNTVEGFTKTADGFSDLILELYGQELGMHARSSIGVQALPVNLPVIIDALVEVAA